MIIKLNQLVVIPIEEFQWTCTSYVAQAAAKQGGILPD